MDIETAPTGELPSPDELAFEWRCDSSGVLTFLSSNFSVLTGLDAAGLIGRPAFGAPNPPTADDAIAAMRSAAARGSAFQGLELLLSDGTSTRKVFLSGRAEPDHAKESTEFSGIGLCAAMDEVRTPDASAETLDDGMLLSGLLEIGRLGYSRFDLATGGIQAFGLMREILGVPDGITDLDRVKAKLLKEDVVVYEAARDEALSTGQQVKTELRFGQDRSDCRHVLVRFEPAFDERGSVTALFSVHQDITEHRASERALLEAQRIGRMGHWRRYESGKENYWSETLLEIFGVTEWRNLGKLPADFVEQLIHPDDFFSYSAARDRSLKTGADYDVVVRVNRPDGRTAWVVIRGHPVFDAVGVCTGTVGTVQDISAHKELEQQVLQSDRWFRRAQRLGSIGHWTFEAADRRIYFSEEAQRIFDCVGIASLTFQEVKERIYPDDWPVLDRMRDQVAAHRKGLDLEVRLRRADGNIAFLKVAAEFDYDESGTFKRTFGTILDATPRAEAEAARQDAEAVMTDIFENADSGILVRDLSGRFLRANTRAAIQLGLRIDDILGHTVEEVLARSERMEGADKLRDAAYRVAATRGSVTYDYSFTPEGGGPTTEFRVVNFPISRSGGAVRAIASMRYDITEFVQAQAALQKLNESLEQTVRKRTQELRRSEERFRNIASASADWLWELDAGLNLIWCSDNFFEQTGRRREDYIGKPFTALASEQERLIDQKGPWSEFIATLEARKPVRGIEIQRAHPSGPRTVRINAKPVWSEGNFIGYQGSTADVTELKQAQAQLIESERLASLGGLVAGISHEINTPVGASFTVVTKLTRSLTDLQQAYDSRKIGQSMFSRFLAEQNEGLGIIRRGLERTSELISHFKQVAVDQTSHKRRTFDLLDLTRDIVATMEATIGAHKVSIEAKVPEGIELDSFPGPLGQVLINLIQNCILHAFDEDDDEPGRILIEAELPGAGSVVLTVSDNGKGMPREIVRRIFEPFFTTRFGSGGSGLGMHVVYTIVNGVLGGAVSVTSRPGEGTGVSIQMPLVVPDKPNGEVVTEESRSQPG